MIRLAKASCHNGHVIMQYCYPGDDPEPSDTVLRKTIDDYIRAGQIPAHCQVCRSREFSYSDGPTRFSSHKEAEAVLGAELLKRFSMDRMLWPNRN